MGRAVIAHDKHPAGLSGSPASQDAELRDGNESNEVRRAMSRQAALSAEVTLEEGEERYRALISAVPDFVLRLKTDGTVVSYQGDAAFPLPHAGQAMRGNRLEELLPEPLAHSFQQGIARAVTTGKVQVLEYTAPTNAGMRQRAARIAVEGDHVAVIIRDVTEQKLAEAERDQRMARLEMLDAISRAFAGATLDYAAALDLAARGTSGLIGDLCILAELSGDEQSLLPIAAYDRHAPVRERIAQLLELGPLPAQNTPLDVVLELGDTLLLNDATDAEIEKVVQPVQRELLLGLGIHAALALPMRALGRITGVLLLFRHRSGRPYAEEDMVFAQAIADRAAVAIHSARLYSENLRQAEALRRANRNLEERIAERTAELARLNELLRQQATEDSLTGLANRRQFATTLELEIRRARRHGQTLSLLLCDVDFFKRFNDAYGHPRGDECLKQVASVLKTTFRRAGDLVARYGGEEFAVVLPGCGPEPALVLAERLRSAMEALGVPHADPETVVTLSVGCVSQRVDAETSAQVLIQAADDALYRSKAEGRNRVSQAVLESAASASPARTP